MSFFDYIQGIPDGPNNPSDDQPDMKINTDSTFDIIKVDHIGFKQNLGGYHNIIHQPPTTKPAAIPGIGQTYVKTVSGDQELFYESGNGVETQITSGTGKMVAAVNFSVGPSPGFVITINNSVNVSGVTRVSAGLYIIGFTTVLSTQFYYAALTAQGPLSVSAVTIATATQGAAYVPTTALFSMTVYDVSVPKVIDAVFASATFFI